MTTQAENLVRRIAADLSDVERALRAHPYARAFRGGTAPVEAIVPFLGHQYHVAHADVRSGALLVHRFDGGPAGGFCRGFLQGGFEALTEIPVMAEKAGLSEADLRAYEPGAAGFAYAAYVGLLAAHGTAAEVMCGFLVNLPAWGFNCGEIGQGLRENYGWPDRATAFVDAFAALPSFDDEALPVIQAGLDRGESPEHIARVARLIQSYERMFWDAMAAEAGLA